MRRKLSLLSSGVCPSSGYCAVALTSINNLGSLASWSWCLESVELRPCCWLISLKASRAMLAGLGGGGSWSPCPGSSEFYKIWIKGPGPWTRR